MGIRAEDNLTYVDVTLCRMEQRPQLLLGQPKGFQVPLCASGRCRVLLVDETSLRRRHRYVTVVSNAETGELLGVVKHRDFRAMVTFLTSQGHRWCHKVEVVVTDGSPSYRAAIERHLGHATHVVDRFHVVRWFASALIEVRRRVQRIDEPSASPAFSPVILRTRYLQLARADHLGSEQFARLSLALSEDPELWHAWRLLQQLYEIYDAEDETEAAKRIEDFVHAWSDAPVSEFRSVLKTLPTASVRPARRETAGRPCTDVFRTPPGHN